MSWVPATTGATTAAAAAAAREKARHGEEERMTAYNGDELEGWEFKIVRAATRRFKRREAVRQLREEEARSGWEMVEKFDDYRIRFKRRVEHRASDEHAPIDPYRTQIGITPENLGLAVVSVFLGLMALGGLVAYYLARGF